MKRGRNIPRTKATQVNTCTPSKFFGQKRGITKRNSLSHKLQSTIHLNGVEMMYSSFRNCCCFISSRLEITTVSKLHHPSAQANEPNSHPNPQAQVQSRQYPAPFLQARLPARQLESHFGISVSTQNGIQVIDRIPTGFGSHASILSALRAASFQPYSLL